MNAGQSSYCLGILKGAYAWTCIHVRDKTDAVDRINCVLKISNYASTSESRFVDFYICVCRGYDSCYNFAMRVGTWGTDSLLYLSKKTACFCIGFYNSSGNYPNMKYVCGYQAYTI